MNRPLKVAVATWFPREPTAPRGGVESVSVNLIGALARRNDLSVDVVTLDNQLRHPQVFEWKGATIHRLPQPAGSLLGYARQSGRKQVSGYLQSLEADVVHAHDTFGIMTRGLPMPRVFTIHGFIHEDTRHHKDSLARVRAMAWKREELAAWSEQPHIISISPYVRERLRGIARGMIHDIENPVDGSFFDLPRRERDGVIFSAAVISPRKNQLALVQAFDAFRGAREAELRLAGPVGEEAYGCRLSEAASDSARVTLLGSLPVQEIQRELSTASVFALASLEEGAPMGIAEAMAAGVPVVASNRCGIPYMVRHGETGFLIDPTNPGDIAHHLSELLDHPELRLSMGAAARACARERHHPDRVAARTVGVYRRAISDNSRCVHDLVRAAC